VLLFNDFISRKLNKVFAVENTIKEADESSQVIEIAVLEFKAIILFNIKES
jgi:hypothetical protein